MPLPRKPPYIFYYFQKSLCHNLARIEGSTQTSSLRTLTPAQVLVATGPQSLFTPGKVAPATHLKMYVPFIPKVLVPFPVDRKEESIQTWSLQSTDPIAAGLSVRSVQRKDWCRRTREHVGLPSLGQMVVYKSAQGRGYRQNGLVTPQPFRIMHQSVLWGGASPRGSPGVPTAPVNLLLGLCARSLSL